MFRSRFSADNSDKMSADSTKTKMSMKSFYIYNSTLCPREGEEEKKILFYHPAENDLNQKIKDVGFSEAIVKATSDFLGNSDKYMEHLRTQKTIQLYFQPEKEFWMVLIVNIPYEKKTNKDNTEQIDYFGEDVHEKIYGEILRQSYRMFRLFHNSFASNMTTESTGPELLISTLEKFYSKYLLTLNLQNADILDCLNCCIQYFPINHFNFLRIINFVNMLETHFTSICNCIYLYNEQVIYSAINPIDLYSISEYLNSNLFPKMRQRDPSGDLNGTDGSFLTGPSCLDPCADVPELFILNTKTSKYEKFHVISFKVCNSTLCMMVKDYDPKNLELFKELKSYVQPQLASITKDIEDSMNTVNNVSADKQSSNESTANHQKYLYFNDLNRRFYATFYDDLAKNNNRLLKNHTIPADVMNLIVDLYTRDCEEKSSITAGFLESDKETIVKSEKHTDYWIIKRSSNSRHLFLIMHKNSTLIEIADESKKIMDSIIKNVYFNKQ